MHFTYFPHFSREFCLVGLSLRRCERQNVLLGHTSTATSQQLPGTVTKVLGGTKSSEPGLQKWSGNAGLLITQGGQRHIGSNRMFLKSYIEVSVRNIAEVLPMELWLTTISCH